MRKRATGGGLTLQGIAGNNAIFLGLDLTQDARQDCLGFALYREDHTEDERYWLSGFKTFESVVPAPDPTTFYSTLDHPVQSFYWGDYTAKPAHDYTYRVVPRYGTPGNLESKPGVEATIDISTNDPSTGTHGIYFNRGTAASQAYANKFGLPPNKLPVDKREDALIWLSRGLNEALVSFIDQASSDSFALRAALFEFTEPGVLAAFKRAHEAGADVQIVRHAKADSTGNAGAAAMAAAGIDPAITIGRSNGYLGHNKFVVLCHKDGAGELTPVAVWTGSTNISDGAIFGHSNVGHLLRDADVAGRYLDYWHQLATDPEPATLRAWANVESPFDPNALLQPGVHTLFSPRSGLGVLNWYASRFGEATAAANVTMAFGMGKVFEDTLIAYAGDALHYVMLDKRDSAQETWSTNTQVFVSVGSSGGPDQLYRWAKESLTGFNPMVPYVHTKFLLIDPLGADPTVITGSANFSPASTSENDENMLVIQGDTEVADIYFTEFARIFIHFYARWWASQLSTGPDDAMVQSYLAETDSWQDPYFTPGNPKHLQRTLYSTKVEGNL